MAETSLCPQRQKTSPRILFEHTTTQSQQDTQVATKPKNSSLGTTGGLIFNRRPKIYRQLHPMPRTKVRKGKVHAPLHPNAIPNTPWEHISVNLIGPLPDCPGYNAIIVIVTDSPNTSCTPQLTGTIRFGAARIYWDHVWTQFGLPRKTISDRVTICSTIHARPHTMTGVEPTSPPHTTPNWRQDQTHQSRSRTVPSYLRERKTNNCPHWLPSASFSSIMTKTHSSTGYSPFLYQPRDASL